MPTSGIRPVRFALARTAARVTAAAVFLALATIASAQVAGGIVGTPSSQQVPVQGTGTGKITGQVVAADNGTPIKRAVVMLFGVRPAAAATAPATPVRDGVTLMLAGSASIQAETDDAGQFQFAQLPAGRFSISVTPKTGFVRPEQPENVRLADGQSATVSIKLARAGAITGRVLDESGDPLARVQVSALRRDSISGRSAGPIGMGAMATTDDLGHFRLYDLPPGDYYVRGNYFNPTFMTPGAERPRVGYGPTYYPGATNLEGARRVTVRTGQEAGAIEFTMQRVPLGRVYGIALDAAGRPFAAGAGPLGGSVMIVSKQEPSSGRGPGLKPDGSFDMRDVTPGDYYLVATVMRGSVGPEGEREAAYVPFTINGDEVNLNIQTNKGATLSGRVVIEGDASQPAVAPLRAGANALPARPQRTTITLRPDFTEQPMSVTSTLRPVQVADDGTFTITGVRGFVHLGATSSTGAILKSVLRAGQDISSKPMVLQGTEQVTDLVVVLTTETGVIQGMVTDSNGEPVAAASIVIFPEDSERWYAGSPSIAVMRNGVGGFPPMRLLPGRYLVAALPPGAPAGTDREFLEKLRAAATAVTVTVGQPTEVRLRVSR